jgi:hypothetical protein
MAPRAKKISGAKKSQWTSKQSKFALYFDTAEDHQLVRDAAKADRLPASRWAMRVVVAEARKRLD